MQFFKILSMSFLISFFVLSTVGECAEKKIVINLPGHSLALYNGEEKVRLYPIAIGKPSTPTPTGYYKIRSKDKNPRWTDPSNHKNTVAPGPNNPLGMRWMQIYGNYGIHGTNNPNSIGHYVSNGCIRMFEENVEELFDLVEIGTPVEITYNRVVVEKTAENVIAYYIYPDHYNIQPLTVADIKKWLAGFGMQDFVSDADILAKISASDGTPTFIGKANTIIVNGNKLKEKAVQKDGVMYLPVAPVADKLNEKYTLEKATVMSNYAETQGKVFGNNIYLDARDLEKLFNVDGSLSKNNEFIIGNEVLPDKETVKDTVSEEPKTPVEVKEPAIETKETKEIKEIKEIKEAKETKEAKEAKIIETKPAVNTNEIKQNIEDKKDKKDEVKKEETKTKVKRKESKQIKRGKPIIVRKKHENNEEAQP